MWVFGKIVLCCNIYHWRTCVCGDDQEKKSSIFTFCCSFEASVERAVYCANRKENASLEVCSFFAPKYSTFQAFSNTSIICEIENVMSLIISYAQHLMFPTKELSSAECILSAQEAISIMYILLTTEASSSCGQRVLC